MASELSDIAKRMLVDPEWARLFKLNVEILSDSLHYGFLALATLALAIKFTEHFGRRTGRSCAVEGRLA